MVWQCLPILDLHLQGHASDLGNCTQHKLEILQSFWGSCEVTGQPLEVREHKQYPRQPTHVTVVPYHIWSSYTQVSKLMTYVQQRCRGQTRLNLLIKMAEVTLINFLYLNRLALSTCYWGGTPVFKYSRLGPVIEKLKTFLSCNIQIQLVWPQPF